MSKSKTPDDTPRMVTPADLIGGAEVMALLGIQHRSTLTRRIESGAIPYLVQLDGPGGPYVFDRQDILALRAAK